MKFKIQKVIRTVPLKDYDTAYEGESLHVWVNPPRSNQMKREELDQEYIRLVATQLKAEKNREKRMESAADEKARERIRQEATDALERFKSDMAEFNQHNFAWYAELWSQEDDSSTHWSVEEIQDLYNAEPALSTWLADRTQDLLREHREQQKKS